MRAEWFSSGPISNGWREGNTTCWISLNIDSRQRVQYLERKKSGIRGELDILTWGDSSTNTKKANKYITKLKNVMCHVIICLVLLVTCHMSLVTCHLSLVTCHLSPTTTATTINSPRANCPTIYSGLFEKQ